MATECDKGDASLVVGFADKDGVPKLFQKIELECTLAASPLTYKNWKAPVVYTANVVWDFVSIIPWSLIALYLLFRIGAFLAGSRQRS